jgi:hypothetical protein
MAYNANIPQPADQLKNSQPQILANFQEINTAFNVNHVGFNVADEGKHKFIQFPQQGGTIATGATEMSLLNLVGANSGVSELNYRRQNNGLTIPFTESFLGPSGWTFYPSGFTAKWGFADIDSNVGATGASFNIVLPPTAEYRAFTAAPYFVNFSTSSNGVIATGLGVVVNWDYASTTATTLYGSFYQSKGTGWPAFRIYYYAIGVSF